MQTHRTQIDNPNLGRLGDLDECKIADGEPDIRGWSVQTADGREAGKVDDLIVDTQAMKVRYMDVALDRKAFGLDEDRHVILPLSNARLDDDRDDVVLGSLTAAQLAALQAGPAMRDMPADDDVRRFYGKRGGTGVVTRTGTTGTFDDRRPRS